MCYVALHQHLDMMNCLITLHIFMWLYYLIEFFATSQAMIFFHSIFTDEKRLPVLIKPHVLLFQYRNECEVNIFLLLCTSLLK